MTPEEVDAFLSQAKDQCTKEQIKSLLEVCDTFDLLRTDDPSSVGITDKGLVYLHWAGPVVLNVYVTKEGQAQWLAHGSVVESFPGELLRFFRRP